MTSTMCLFYSSVPVSHVTATVSQLAQYHGPETENLNNADPFFSHLEAAEQDKLLLIPRREIHRLLTENSCLLWLQMLLMRAVGVK